MRLLSWARASAALLVTLVVYTPACRAPTGPSQGTAPPDLTEVVDAIFFGSGPLAHPDRDCPLDGRWAAYPRQSAVALVLASSVDAPAEQSLTRTVADLQQVIDGRFQLTIERTSQVEPMPRLNQITSADVSDAQIRATCSPGASGCTRLLFTIDGMLAGARCIQREGTSTRLKNHEFGHAIGLCHIDPTRIPDALMAPTAGALPQDRFSLLELEAIRAVYASSLEPGATREDFRRAGLIR